MGQNDPVCNANISCNKTCLKMKILPIYVHIKTLTHNIVAIKTQTNVVNKELNKISVQKETTA
jgi:hypothetical protein